MTVTGGDRRAVLEMLRDRLLEEAAEAVGKDLAPVSRELRATLVELDSLPVPGSAAPADEIARRREMRRQEAAGW